MTPAINRTMGPSTWALLLTLALLWGGSYFYNAVAITSVPPLTIVAARTLIGAIALYATVRLSGARISAIGVGPARDQIVVRHDLID